MTSELEALKRLLHAGSSPASVGVDDPQPSSKPASPLDVDAIMKRFDATIGALEDESPVGLRDTQQALNSHLEQETYEPLVSSTEAKVERLAGAMDDAERELDAAFARHRDSKEEDSKQKDSELDALRSELDAKQRAVESLRDTLANTRTVLEARVTDADDQTAKAEQETKVAKETIRDLIAERDDLLEKLKTEHATSCANLDEYERLAQSAEQRENEAGNWVRKAVEARAKAETQLVSTEQELDVVRETCQKYKNELDAETKLRKETLRKLNKYRVLYHKNEMNKSLETAETAEQRKRNENVEEWLKKELQNREHTELLFMNLRDLALRPDDNKKAIDALRDELDEIKRIAH